jgi:hypothetical protein
MSERKVCYCNSCWRNEYHSPVRVDWFSRVLIVLLTLGLAVVLWPYRCQCCGQLRPLHWFSQRA